MLNISEYYIDRKYYKVMIKYRTIKTLTLN